MEKYKFTAHFLNEVLRKRPYIKKEWCCKIIENPIKVEKQEGNRYRFWGKVEEFGNRIIRAVTLEDKLTILDAGSGLQPEPHLLYFQTHYLLHNVFALSKSGFRSQT